MLRNLIRYLANNEKLITKLADSKPMRRAAQLVVYMFMRVKSDPASPDSLRGFLTQLKTFAQKQIGDIKKSIENKKD